MDEQLIDAIITDLRSRLTCLKSKDYHIDIYVKDGKSYLIFTADAFEQGYPKPIDGHYSYLEEIKIADDFERKLP